MQWDTWTFFKFPYTVTISLWQWGKIWEDGFWEQPQSKLPSGEGRLPSVPLHAVRWLGTVRVNILLPSWWARFTILIIVLQQQYLEANIPSVECEERRCTQRGKGEMLLITRLPSRMDLAYVLGEYTSATSWLLKRTDACPLSEACCGDEMEYLKQIWYKKFGTVFPTKQ